MKNNKRLAVWLCATLQIMGGTVFAQQLDPARAKLMDQRLEIAEQYLVAAGIEPPEQLDLAHLPQLRAEFERFLIDSSQQPLTAVNVETDSNGSASGSGVKAAPTLLEYLHPSPWNRFLRLQQFKAEALEQTKTVFVQTPGQPKPVPTLNPDHVLWKYSLSFNFSELSLSSADLATIHGAYNKYAGDGKNPVLAVSQSQDCKNPAEFVRCMRRVRAQDFFWRAVSGFNATLSYGQSPRVQQNIFIAPDTSVAKALHLYSGQIDFDPKSLFPSGTDWDNATKSLDAFVINKKAAIGNPCHVDVDCLRRLAAPPAKWAVVSAFVPTFTFKVQTQFDFVKNTGGEFIRSPFPEGHLWSLAFTADLRRAIPSLKARTDALSALKILNASSANQTQAECFITVPDAIAGSLYSYSLDSDNSDRRWEFQPDSCTRATDRVTPFKKAECESNGLVLKTNGTLTGYPRSSRRETLKLLVRSAGDNPIKCDVELRIQPGGQDSATRRLLLDYVDIALTPDILLDDKWFLELSRIASQVFGNTNLAKHEVISEEPRR